MKIFLPTLLLASFHSIVSGNNEVITLNSGEEFEVYPQPLENARDFIYCEMVFNYDTGSDLYSTSPLAPCDPDWWASIDLVELAANHSAVSAFRNGPQYWSMDFVQLNASDPHDIAGVQMVFGATFEAGTIGETKPYEVFFPTKTQYLRWDQGKPTYRLTDNDGYQYLVQGYKVAASDLPTLGDKFEDLPEGWSYSVVDLDEDLIFNLTPAEAIPSVQDEFDQIYIRIPDDPETMDAETNGGSSNAMLDAKFGWRLWIGCLASTAFMI